MTVNKLTFPSKENAVQEKINEIIDNLGGGGGASALTDLSDVSITSAASGDVLSYNGNNWINTNSYLQNIATGTGAISVGKSAEASTANEAINIGAASKATKTASIALGGNAKATAIGAIQLGFGTNSTGCSFSVGGFKSGGLQYNWQLLDGQTGLIPDARLSSNIARNADIDGNWTSSASQVVSGVSLNYSSNYSIGLSSYLPNDDNLYEVTLTARATSGTATNNFAPIHLTLSNYGADILVCYAKSYSNAANYANGCLVFYAKSSTTMALKRSTDYRGTADIWFLGYRKVR